MTKKEPFVLREHQVEALDILEGSIALGSNNNLVLRAVTSFGKAAIIAKMAETYQDEGVIIVVTITELIDQISEHLNLFDVEHSILKAGRDKDFDASKKVQLVMAQTLYARIDKIKFDHHFYIYQFDEAHKEWDTKRTKAILEHIRPTNRISYTATPWDSLGFALHGAEIINTAGDRYLTEKGYLTPMKYYVPRWSEKIDYSKFKMSAGDYKMSDLDSVVGSNMYMDGMVKSMNHLQIKEDGKKFIIFTTTVEMCNRISQLLQENGYDAEAYHTKIHEKTLRNIMASFKTGENYIGPHNQDKDLFEKDTIRPAVKGLVSIAKLTTGFSENSIDIGIMARKFGPSSLFHQCVGRVKRISPGKEFGHILDLGGNISTHNFPETDYVPPEKTGIKEIDKQNLTEAKSHLSMEHMVAIITSNDPEEITRERYEVVLNELKNNKKKLTNMTTRELSNKLEVSDDPLIIIAITCVLFDHLHNTEMEDNYGRASRGYISNKGKTVVGFVNASSIDWMAEEWIELLQGETEYYKTKYIKSLKTRCKNMIINKNSIYGIRYFLSYLLDQDKLDKEIAKEAQKPMKIEYEGFDNEDIDEDAPF